MSILILWGSIGRNLASNTSSKVLQWVCSAARLTAFSLLNVPTYPYGPLNRVLTKEGTVGLGLSSLVIKWDSLFLGLWKIDVHPSCIYCVWSGNFVIRFPLLCYKEARLILACDISHLNISLIRRKYSHLHITGSLHDLFLWHIRSMQEIVQVTN